MSKQLSLFSEEEIGPCSSHINEYVPFVSEVEEFNQTFVIVTHNKDLAKMADRTLTMMDGKFIR